MKTNNKKLYEDIMTVVAKKVKKALIDNTVNETFEDTNGSFKLVHYVSYHNNTCKSFVKDCVNDALTNGINGNTLVQLKNCYSDETAVMKRILDKYSRKYFNVSFSKLNSEICNGLTETLFAHICKFIKYDLDIENDDNWAPMYTVHRNNESIMTSLPKEVKTVLNESTVARKIKTRVYNVLFYNLAPEIQGETVTLEDIAHEPRFLKKIAGYLIEEKVKAAISRSFITKTDYGYIVDKYDPKYEDGGDNWWDFSIDGEKVEVKAF
jgi:hypothetical protein